MSKTRKALLVLALFATPFANAANAANTANAADAPRLLGTGDVFALKTVGGPQISPEGAWVAFSVRTLDAKEDRGDSDLYMVPIAGGEAVRLTSSPKSETTPRFSPDGRYLAFLSAREGTKSQVWLLDRRGGEAVKLTDYKASVSDLAWSPDGKRLALIVGDVDPDDPDLQTPADGAAAPPAAGAAETPKPPKTPKPIVLHRRQFMRDGEGYLRDLHEHLYVFDVAAKTSVQVTSGSYDDREPVWSPDGRRRRGRAGGRRRAHGRRLRRRAQGGGRAPREPAHLPLRGVAGRRRRSGSNPAPAVAGQRRLPARHPPRQGRADGGQEPGRPGDRRLPDPAAGRRRGPHRPWKTAPPAHRAAHPRRSGLAVLDRLPARVADPRRARLRGGRRQPARLLGLRPRLQPRHLGRLGEQGLHRRHGRRRPGGRPGDRRPRPPGGGRLELW